MVRVCELCVQCPDASAPRNIPPCIPETQCRARCPQQSSGSSGGSGGSGSSGGGGSGSGSDLCHTRCDNRWKWGMVECRGERRMGLTKRHRHCLFTRGLQGGQAEGIFGWDLTGLSLGVGESWRNSILPQHQPQESTTSFSSKPFYESPSPRDLEVS